MHGHYYDIVEFLDNNSNYEKRNEIKKHYNNVNQINQVKLDDMMYELITEWSVFRECPDFLNSNLTIERDRDRE